MYHLCAVTLITNPLSKAVKSVTCLEVGKAVEGGELMEGTVESLFQYHPIILSKGGIRPSVLEKSSKFYML